MQLTQHKSTLMSHMHALAQTLLTTFVSMATSVSFLNISANVGINGGGVERSAGLNNAFLRSFKRVGEAFSSTKL